MEKKIWWGNNFQLLLYTLLLWSIFWVMGPAGVSHFLHSMSYALSTNFGALIFPAMFFGYFFLLMKSVVQLHDFIDETFRNVDGSLIAHAYKAMRR